MTTPTNHSAAALIAALALSCAALAQPAGDKPTDTRPADAKPAENKPPQTPGVPLPAGIVAADARAERIADGHAFTEGPVWVDEPGGGALYYSDIPKNAIFVWREGAAAAEFITPSGQSNGLISGPDGSLIAAAHAGRVDVLAPGKPRRTLAEKFEGKGLNSPNDLCAGADGAIYFTDPPYGLRGSLSPGGRTRELEFSGVYRLSTDGTLTLLHQDLRTPNGLALSPDAKTLYVADTSTGTITAFALKPDGTLDEARPFAATKDPESGKPAGADGLKVDTAGNVYCAGRGGVWVFSAAGDLLGRIPVDRNVTNICFGGPDRTWLFATTGSAVYRVRTLVPGLRTPAPRLAPARVSAPDTPAAEPAAEPAKTPTP